MIVMTNGMVQWITYMQIPYTMTLHYDTEFNIQFSGIGQWKHRFVSC